MQPADVLNHVVNQPEVLRYVAPGYRSLDLSGFFQAPNNIFMGDLDGAILFGALGDDIYDMHYLLTDAVRGRDAIQFVRGCLHLMFTQYGARAITGATPRDNMAARCMNRALGARPVGETTDIHGRLCIKYVLERATWAKSLAASLAASVH